VDPQFSFSGEKSIQPDRSTYRHRNPTSALKHSFLSSSQREVLRGNTEIPLRLRETQISLCRLSGMQATIHRDLRRRYRANVGSRVVVTAIFLVLAFRGGMVLWQGIVASNEPMPVELRVLPSPDELPRIPPARSWNV